MKRMKLALRSFGALGVFVTTALFLPACLGDSVPIGEDGAKTRPGQNGCVISGCGGELCGETEMVSTCEVRPEDACYRNATCGRNADGVCAWVETPELLACLDDDPEERTPVTGACIRNSGDACATDADCVSGGCGGELCYNPAVSEGISTCECVAPTTPSGCGCVQGSCTWYSD